MQHMKIRLSLLSAGLALGVLATACGSQSVPQPEAADVSSTMPAEPDIMSKPVTTEVSSPDASKPKVTLDNVAQTTTPEPTTEAGDDPFGPRTGEEIGVVGVRFDDVLNVRAGPGVDEEIVATLDPLARTTATGRHLQLAGGAFWWEVSAGGTTGWAHSAFLSRLSDPVSLSGIDTTLVADDLAELGRTVVEGRLAAFDPKSTVTMVLAPRGEHDHSEVVFDVTGSGDDSISGYRFHVHARPTDDRQAFQLLGLDVTTMCWRAVHNGVCA